MNHMHRVIAVAGLLLVAGCKRGDRQAEASPTAPAPTPHVAEATPVAQPVAAPAKKIVAMTIEQLGVVFDGPEGTAWRCDPVDRQCLLQDGLVMSIDDNAEFHDSLDNAVKRFTTTSPDGEVLERTASKGRWTFVFRTGDVVDFVEGRTLRHGVFVCQADSLRPDQLAAHRAACDSLRQP